jgi:Ca-activated chloride channel homolog
VSLATPWALLGLLAAIPLALLHLRRRRPHIADVPSLLAWRRSPAPVGASTRRLGKPAHPLLLALQLLALLLLVLALARPHIGGGAPDDARAFVLDDSIWMGASEGGTTRLASAEATLRGELEALPGDRRVAVVAAGAEPKVLYEGSAGGAADAVGKLAPTYGPADLGGAVAAALGASGGSAVEVLRAPEEEAPSAPSGAHLRERIVGAPIADQGLAAPSARCLPGGEHCEIFARVRNAGTTPATDRVSVSGEAGPISSQSVRVPAGGSAAVAFGAPAGARLELALTGGDPLAADDHAFVDVPEAGAPVRITLVGEEADAEPLARALLAAPGAEVTLRTPRDFRPADARHADLLVIDGRPPRKPVPAGVPATIRIDPPRLPGGKVGGELARSRLSGTDPTASVLDGVDLGSLAIGAKGAHKINLPPWLRAAAWAPGGPLLALGTHRGAREAVLAFDPARSDLPQLASFPRLVDNLVAWSGEWAPGEVVAGAPFLAGRPAGAGPTTIAAAAGASRSARSAVKLPRPGFYALEQRGPWGTRTRSVVANAELPAANVEVPDAGRVARGIGVQAPALTPIATTAGHDDGTDLAPWLLAAAFLVLLVEGVLSVRLESAARGFLVLRGAALTFLVVALLRPALGHDAPPTAIVVQGPEGVGPSGQATARHWVKAAEACSGECRLSVAGDDLESAVRAAASTTPHGGRLVVLSNGRQAGGEATAAAATARSRGVEVDTVPLAEGGADAAVTRLQLPGALHAGDPLPVEVNVRSTVAGPARLSLYEDGKSRGARKVRLAVGDNPYLLSLTAGGPGAHGYRVAIHIKGDGSTANDALAATVRVVRRPRALVVSAGASPLAALLEDDGIAVTAATPAAVPSDPAALAAYDVVALDDVAAPELGDARAAALATAARTGRTGLLVLGGPHAFSLGRYYESPLQDALPVSSLKPGNLQRKNLALEMVLDRSGSMTEAVEGVEKIAMVRAATKAATGFIAKHDDQFGAIAFDVGPHNAVPLTALKTPADAEAANAAIRRIHAEGGTNIYKALAAGVRQIEQSHEKNRHIVLLSDGISEKGSYAALVPQLKADDITVSTIALGMDADFELLKGIADQTGGRFYKTEDPHQLPKIFAKEARAAARPVRLHGKIGVTPGEDSPIVRDLAGSRLPVLSGNVVAQLKPGAGAVLLGADKHHPPDPVLAQWQYGAGRVVAWTPGLGDWASAYAKLPALFADAARWVEPAVAPTPLTPRLVPGEEGELEVDEAEGPAPAEGVSELEGSLVAPGGKPTPLTLEQGAPWRFLAALPDRSPGVDAYALRGNGRTARGLLAVPYPAVLMPLPAEATPLGPLAANAGGRVIDPGDVGTLDGDRHALWWWAALAALICFLADVGYRLLPRRRSRRAALRPRPGAGPSVDRRAGRAVEPTSTPA